MHEPLGVWTVGSDLQAHEEAVSLNPEGTKGAAPLDGDEVWFEADWGRGRGGGATTDRVRVSVEELVLQEYAMRGGWRGLHDEGSLLRAICALLSWEVVFDDSVVGVFATPFQDAPIDLDASPGFYKRRKAAITAMVARVAAASRAELVSWLAMSYASNRGKLCRGIRWGRGEYPLPLIQLAAVCLGGRALAQIIDGLLYDHKQRSGGLPDLFIWRVLAPSSANPAPPASSLASSVPSSSAAKALETGVLSGSLRLVSEARYECRFVEVKGPRDRLADKQRCWLRLLLAAGCRVDLCRVQEPAKRAGKRSKLQEEAEVALTSL